jgi:hypothetical protein
LHTHYVDTSDTTTYSSGSVITIEASATGAVAVDDDVTVLRAETTPPTLAGTFVSATFDTTDVDDVEIDLAIDGLELVQGRAQWKIEAGGTWAPSTPSWSPASKTADEFTITMATGMATSALAADTLYTRYALRDSLDNESAYTDAVKTVFARDASGGADYAVASFGWHISVRYTGSNIRMAIYDSDYALLDVSSSTPRGTTGEWNSASWSGPTLSPGSTYYLAICADGNIAISAVSGTIYDERNDNSSSFEIPPDPTSVGSSQSGGELCIWVKNASGTVLLGTDGTPGGNESQLLNDIWAHTLGGYVVAVQ